MSKVANSFYRNTNLYSFRYVRLVVKMPLENREEEGLEKNPNLELAQWKFLLSLPDYKDDKTIQEKLISAIKTESKKYEKCLLTKMFLNHIIFLNTHILQFFADMAPWYAEVCKDLGWTVDENLLSTMKANNAAALVKLDETIEDAEKNLGEMEVDILPPTRFFFLLKFFLCCAILI